MAFAEDIVLLSSGSGEDRGNYTVMFLCPYYKPIRYRGVDGEAVVTAGHCSVTFDLSASSPSSYSER